MRSYSEIIRRLEDFSGSPYINIETLGSFYVDITEYPMFVINLGTPSPEKLSVLISAGIHGDEPAGVEATLRFIEYNIDNPILLDYFSFVIFPCDNPHGWERNIRENFLNLDLNRQFRVKEPSPEIQLIMKGLRGRCFDLVYEMHEDCESPGFYLYDLEKIKSFL